MTVRELTEALKQYPEDATAYAYEGEVQGVVIWKDNEQIGFIEAWDPH